MGVRIDDCVVSNRDGRKTDISIALDAESPDRRLVEDAIVTKREKVELGQSGRLVDANSLANPRSEKSAIQLDHRWVHREDATTGCAESGIHNPPPQMIGTPPWKSSIRNTIVAGGSEHSHFVFSRLVRSYDDPFEDDSHNRADNAGA